MAYTGGVNLAMKNSVCVRALSPGETTDISVDMNSPTLPGMYESKWRMATPNGCYFGGKREIRNFRSIFIVFFFEFLSHLYLLWIPKITQKSLKFNENF